MNMHEKGLGSGPVRVLRIAGLAVLGVVGAAVFALAFGWFVQLLWNWLMPAIFGLGTITYWQGFGVALLAKLIFGGLGGGHRRPPSRDRGPGEKHGPWMPPEGERRWARDRWSLWKDFWNEEGKEAFERYVERKRGGSSAAPSGTPDGTAAGPGQS